MDHPISTTYLDRITARVSAVLLGAGAWDVAPIELVCPGFKHVNFACAYKRGGAAGAVNWRIETSPDSAGTVWYQASHFAAGVLAAGADTVSNLQRGNTTYTATGAAIERFNVELDLDGVVERIRIAGRETGNAGAPGTLAIEALFS